MSVIRIILEINFLVIAALPTDARIGPGRDIVTKVLAANAEFYKAFHHRNHAGKGAIWGWEKPITVIHPGWPALHGGAAVMRSWPMIMSCNRSPRI